MTINGRHVDNDGILANNPGGVGPPVPGPFPGLVSGSVLSGTGANIFFDDQMTASMNGLLGQVFVTGWSMVRPVPNGPFSILGGPDGLVQSSTGATAELLGVTLPESGLATSQVFPGPASMGFTELLGTGAASFFAAAPHLVGDPLASSGNIVGPLVVPPWKYDTVNSSNVGDIGLDFATAPSRKVFRADVSVPKPQLRMRGLVANLSPPPPGGGRVSCHL